jgi:excisionase family DNA binding protein
MADLPSAAAPAKLSYRIPEAVAATGIARSSLYEVIKAGDLKTRKLGARTLIDRAELERFIASLPPGSES